MQLASDFVVQGLICLLKGINTNSRENYLLVSEMIIGSCELVAIVLGTDVEPAGMLPFISRCVYKVKYNAKNRLHIVLYNSTCLAEERNSLKLGGIFNFDELFL